MDAGELAEPGWVYGGGQFSPGLLRDKREAGAEGMREGLEVGRSETQPGRGGLEGGGTGREHKGAGGEGRGQRASRGLRGQAGKGRRLRGGVSGLPRGLGLPAPKGESPRPGRRCRIRAQPRRHRGAAAAIRRPGNQRRAPPAGPRPIGGRHARPAANGPITGGL